MAMKKPPVHPGLAQAIIDAGGRAQLAEICGCKRQNIEYLELHGRPLSPQFVAKAAKALGRSPHDLNPEVFPKGTKLP
jgi:hypothetical protein